MYAIVVSDVHLGYDGKCDNIAFEDFINDLTNINSSLLGPDGKLDHLILIGDILDLWRRENTSLLNQFRNLIQKIHDIPTVRHKHWVWGNHDYETCLRGLITDNIGNNFLFTDVLHLPEEGLSLPNGKRYCFIHGHQLVFGRKGYELAGATLCQAGDLAGGAMSHTWEELQELKVKTWNPIGNWFREKYFEYIQKDPEDREGEDPVTGTIQRWFWEFYSNRKSIDLHDEGSVRKTAMEEVNLKEQEILVFGHTHEKWDGDLVYNTGCWYKNEEHWYYRITDQGIGSLEKW